MNIAGEIAVTLAALIGFGRIFLADEGASHRVSGLLILAGAVGKVALSI
jgi:hypothetical protein